MDVRVDEARDDGHALAADDGRAGIAGLPDLGVVADGDDPIAGEGDRRRAGSGRVEREDVGAEHGDIGGAAGSGECGHVPQVAKSFCQHAHDACAKTFCQVLLSASMTRPTIRDVAAAAGVSPTTVSHALNGKGRVDAATRARVEATAVALGYRPSRVAQGLRSGRTGTLGLALPEMPDTAGSAEMIGVDFYLQVAAGATRAAFASDHALLLLPTLRDAADVQRLGLDGAILNDPATNDPRIDAFDAAGVPVVTLDRDLGRPQRPWVASDTQANTRRALDHMAEAGAHRIALLTMAAQWSWLVDTEEAYQAWCTERGREPLVQRSPLNVTDAIAAQNAGALLDRRRPPDAIFTPPERYAVAVGRAAATRGLALGSDLLLAAGVDSHEARTHDPPITALELHPARQGAEAVRLLEAILAGQDPGAPRLVEAELRVRASTRR